MGWPNRLNVFHADPDKTGICLLFSITVFTRLLVLLKQIVLVNLLLYSCMISDQKKNKGSLFKFLNVIQLDWPSCFKSTGLSKQSVV